MVQCAYIVNSRKKQNNNEILVRIAAQDQNEREKFFENPDQVTLNDKKRRGIVCELLKRNEVKTSVDFFNAALIYQHGLEADDYRTAQSLAKKSIERGGGEWSRWLYAVATDRLYTTLGRRQKFGTQFGIDVTRHPTTGVEHRVLRMLPYDHRTSDRTRDIHGVPKLAKLLKMDGKTAPRAQKKIIAHSKQ